MLKYGAKKPHSKVRNSKKEAFPTQLQLLSCELICKKLTMKLANYFEHLNKQALNLEPEIYERKKRERAEKKNLGPYPSMPSNQEEEEEDSIAYSSRPASSIQSSQPSQAAAEVRQRFLEKKMQKMKELDALTEVLQKEQESARLSSRRGSPLKMASSPQEEQKQQKQDFQLFDSSKKVKVQSSNKRYEMEEEEVMEEDPRSNQEERREEEPIQQQQPKITSFLKQPSLELSFNQENLFAFNAKPSLPKSLADSPEFQQHTESAEKPQQHLLSTESDIETFQERIKYLPTIEEASIDNVSQKEQPNKIKQRIQKVKRELEGSGAEKKEDREEGEKKGISNKRLDKLRSMLGQVRPKPDQKVENQEEFKVKQKRRKQCHAPPEENKESIQTPLGEFYQLSDDQVMFIEKRGQDYSKNKPMQIKKKKKKQTQQKAFTPRQQQNLSQFISAENNKQKDKEIDMLEQQIKQLEIAAQEKAQQEEKEKFLREQEKERLRIQEQEKRLQEQIEQEELKRKREEEKQIQALEELKRRELELAQREKEQQEKERQRKEQEELERQVQEQERLRKEQKAQEELLKKQQEEKKRFEEEQRQREIQEQQRLQREKEEQEKEKERLLQEQLKVQQMIKEEEEKKRQKQLQAQEEKLRKAEEQIRLLEQKQKEQEEQRLRDLEQKQIEEEKQRQKEKEIQQQKEFDLLSKQQKLEEQLKRQKEQEKKERELEMKKQQEEKERIEREFQEYQQKLLEEAEKERQQRLKMVQIQKLEAEEKEKTALEIREKEKQEQLAQQKRQEQIKIKAANLIGRFVQRVKKNKQHQVIKEILEFSQEIKALRREKACKQLDQILNTLTIPRTQNILNNSFQSFRRQAFQLNLKLKLEKFVNQLENKLESNMKQSMNQLKAYSILQKEYQQKLAIIEEENLQKEKEQKKQNSVHMLAMILKQFENKQKRRRFLVWNRYVLQVQQEELKAIEELEHKQKEEQTRLKMQERLFKLGFKQLQNVLQRVDQGNLRTFLSNLKQECETLKEQERNRKVLVQLILKKSKVFEKKLLKERISLWNQKSTQMKQKDLSKFQATKQITRKLKAYQSNSLSQSFLRWHKIASEEKNLESEQLKQSQAKQAKIQQDIKFLLRIKLNLDRKTQQKYLLLWQLHAEKIKINQAQKDQEKKQLVQDLEEERKRNLKLKFFNWIGQQQFNIQKTKNQAFGQWFQKTQLGKRQTKQIEKLQDFVKSKKHVIFFEFKIFEGHPKPEKIEIKEEERSLISPQSTQPLKVNQSYESASKSNNRYGSRKSSVVSDSKRQLEPFQDDETEQTLNHTEAFIQVRAHQPLRQKKSQIGSCEKPPKQTASLNKFLRKERTPKAQNQTLNNSLGQGKLNNSQNRLNTSVSRTSSSRASQSQKKEEKKKAQKEEEEKVPKVSKTSNALKNYLTSGPKTSKTSQQKQNTKLGNYLSVGKIQKNKTGTKSQSKKANNSSIKSVTFSQQDMTIQSNSNHPNQEKEENKKNNEKQQAVQEIKMDFSSRSSVISPNTETEMNMEAIKAGSLVLQRLIEKKVYRKNMEKFFKFAYSKEAERIYQQRRELEKIEVSNFFLLQKLHRCFVLREKVVKRDQYKKWHAFCFWKRLDYLVMLASLNQYQSSLQSIYN